MSSSHTESNGLKWLMFILSALFYFYGFLLQVSSSVMVPELMHAFHADGSQVGNLSAFFFYAYAIMQIPVGVLLDRFGSRKLLTAAALISAAGCAVFAMADHLLLAQVGRTLIGFGASFAAVGCLNIAATHFPAKRFALLTGVMVGLGMVGAIAGNAPLAWLINHIHWRNTMLSLGAAGVVLAVLMGVFIRDIHNPHATEGETQNLLAGIKYIVKKPASWLVALYGGLMFAPTTAFASLWGTSFLIAQYDITRPHAAALNSIIFWGWLVASPVVGIISDKCGRRMPFLWMASLGVLLCLCGIIYASLSMLTMCIVLFFFGFLSAGFLPSFAVIKETNPVLFSGTAIGFMNTLNMASGAVLQPGIGEILDQHWQGAISHGVHVFSHHSYVLALSTLTGCAVLSILLLPFIKETYGRSSA
ncbi:MAG: MFS transporter [marine bacterium B5-7]|nr:MAG: MFS transporter [marine bacterium B5-7]